MMNTAGQIGYAVSSLVFGYLVKLFSNYEAPLAPMACLLAAGMFLWWRVDVMAESLYLKPAVASREVG
jgi:MFS-type transporter involved in bile tolerance (Atg22 family)